MKTVKYLLASLMLGLGITVVHADNSRVVVGGTLGGAAGAALGYHLDGRDGAIVGAALGGALGAAAAYQRPVHYASHEYVVERPRYRHPPQRVIYVPAPPPRVVYVDRYVYRDDRHRGHRHHKHWKHDRYDRHDRHDRHDRDDYRRWD